MPTLMLVPTPINANPLSATILASTFSATSSPTTPMKLDSPLDASTILE